MGLKEEHLQRRRGCGSCGGRGKASAPIAAGRGPHESPMNGLDVWIVGERKPSMSARVKNCRSVIAMVSVQCEAYTRIRTQNSNARMFLQLNSSAKSLILLRRRRFERYQFLNVRGVGISIVGFGQCDKYKKLTVVDAGLTFTPRAPGFKHILVWPCIPFRDCSSTLTV